MDAFSKFIKFITTNYDPRDERPEIDDKSEFAVQVEMKNGDLVWYGPISFDDLTAFVVTLSEAEMDEFITVVKHDAVKSVFGSLQ